ncbi:MAG: hypothetical protein QW203_03590 [Thermoplasmatales archaeon]
MKAYRIPFLKRTIITSNLDGFSVVTPSSPIKVNNQDAIFIFGYSPKLIYKTTGSVLNKGHLQSAGRHVFISQSKM